MIHSITIRIEADGYGSEEELEVAVVQHLRQFGSAPCLRLIEFEALEVSSCHYS